MNSSNKSFHTLGNQIATFRSLLEISEDNIAGLGSNYSYRDRFEAILTDFHNTLQKMQSSVAEFDDIPFASQTTWERMKYGAVQIDGLQQQLNSNLTLPTSLNSCIIG
jgi:hypothetical protein